MSKKGDKIIENLPPTACQVEMDGKDRIRSEVKYPKEWVFVITPLALLIASILLIFY
jgi:hypothetical protein